MNMDFIRAQRTKIPRIAPIDLSDKTVLITGGNTGLGFESALEILASKPRRLILAVRSLERGNAARQRLAPKATSTSIEVHELDQSSFASVQSFVKGLNGERIDMALLNAGIWNTSFTTTGDGIETDIQVNALAPALLSVLLLPNLRRARVDSGVPSHLSFVSTALHEMAKFPERKVPLGEVFKALSDRKQYVEPDRYPTCKVLGLLWARELATRVAASDIIINSPAPGYCKTGLARNMSGVFGMVMKVTETLLARSAADGARCLVDAVMIKGPETHGRYVTEMKVKAEGGLLRCADSTDLQKRMWDETVELLSRKAGLARGALS